MRLITSAVFFPGDGPPLLRKGCIQRFLLVPRCEAEQLIGSRVDVVRTVSMMGPSRVSIQDRIRELICAVASGSFGVLVGFYSIPGSRDPSRTRPLN